MEEAVESIYVTDAKIRKKEAIKKTKTYVG
jgi:hypothetical protein